MPAQAAHLPYVLSGFTCHSTLLTWIAVGVAVLAFLAVRPGKGWLRKRQAPHRTGAPTDGQLESGKLLSSTEAAGSKLTPSASPHLTPGASTGKQLRWGGHCGGRLGRRQEKRMPADLSADLMLAACKPLRF